MGLIAGLTAVGVWLGASAAWALPVGAGAVTVAATAVGGAVTGGVMGTVSSVQQAQQQEASAEYQAQIAERNIELATREETQIAEQGAFEIRQQKLRQAALIAQGQVAGAAGGVQLGSGSLLDWEVSAQEVFDEDIRQLEYDIENRRYQARIGLWNARTAKSQALVRAETFGEQIPMLAVGGTISTFANTASSALSVGGGLLKLGEAGSLLKSTKTPSSGSILDKPISGLPFTGLLT